jgi:general stress protein 26
VSFADPSSTDWASVAGKASVVKDHSTVKDLWNPTIKSVRRPSRKESR